MLSHNIVHYVDHERTICGLADGGWIKFVSCILCVDAFRFNKYTHENDSVKMLLNNINYNKHTIEVCVGDR